MGRLIYKIEFYCAHVANLVKRTFLRKFYLKKLKDADNLILTKISSALLDSQRRTFSLRELEFLKAIESLRRDLSRSNQVLSIVDYGAGMPGATRTPEEMQSGVSQTLPVCSLNKASIDRRHALFLFKLVRCFSFQSCLELGTNLGVSAAYISSALNLNGQGFLVSLEGDPSKARQARKNLEHLGLNQATVVEGRFLDTLEKTLEKAPSIDFAFIDGHHQGHATLKYFSKIKTYARTGAILIVDDINWNDDMAHAWHSIQKDVQVHVSLDLFRFGLCVLGKTPGEKALHFRIPF